mgnify:CR=1 FL=1
MPLNLETDVAILKKEVSEFKEIHLRLDTAIRKIGEVSNSINRMLAVHEEKIARQDETQDELNKNVEARRKEVYSSIQELHSRITTNSKELMDMITKQHREQAEKTDQLKRHIDDRVGVLERWRHVIMGGSIVIGFILHKFVDFT